MRGCMVDFKVMSIMHQRDSNHVRRVPGITAYEHCVIDLMTAYIYAGQWKLLQQHSKHCDDGVYLYQASTEDGGTSTYKQARCRKLAVLTVRQRASCLTLM